MHTEEDTRKLFIKALKGSMEKAKEDDIMVYLGARQMFIEYVIDQIRRDMDKGKRIEEFMLHLNRMIAPILCVASEEGVDALSTMRKAFLHEYLVIFEDVVRLGSLEEVMKRGQGIWREILMARKKLTFCLLQNPRAEERKIIQKVVEITTQSKDSL